ncbi:hypothetical protein BB560_001615 [Smittium megazygosporum]|uniref:Uncharacterized protein n=1 Tax=Smittium megazygosporum TaxID=133381 RepID=A0A2T9ZH96_9FUNG|nr:hypothetical protein BB560_001615 [Smittium megazygosporum]
MLESLKSNTSGKKKSSGDPKVATKRSVETLKSLHELSVKKILDIYSSSENISSKLANVEIDTSDTVKCKPTVMNKFVIEEWLKL